MPVPKVMTRTMPSTARGGAEAGLGEAGGVGVVDDLHGTAQPGGQEAGGVGSIQDWSTLAAEDHAVLDDAGEGDTHGGVGSRRLRARGQCGDHLCHHLGHGFGRGGLRGGDAQPVTDQLALFRSTIPPLMPVPPMSMPISGAFFFDFSSFLANVVPFVAGGGLGGGGAGPTEKTESSRGNQGRVRTSAPDSVTSRVCSNCAVRLRSRVTTVQSSAHMSQSTVPSVSMGSIVNTMPVSITVL